MKLRKVEHKQLEYSNEWVEEWNKYGVSLTRASIKFYDQ
jgi:hypothetical protein